MNLDYIFTVDNRLEYYFKSKNDLKENSMQNVLKEAHGRRNYIKCKCITEKDLFLQVKKINDLYYLAKYPNSEEHNQNCIFHSYTKDFFNEDENGVIYRPLIFEDVETKLNNKDTSIGDYENAKMNTFYAYCHDLISSANMISFFKANKNKRELNNYSFQDFCSSYYLSLKTIRISKFGHLLNYIKEKKESYFEYGIISEDIVGNLEHINFNPDDIIDINLNRIILDFNTKEYKLVLKTGKIKYKRLEISKKLVTNYSIVPIPYFYNAIYKNGVIIRLYISPIFFDEYNICFVKSRNENIYAEYLFKEGIPFIKPISNNEIDFIYPSKLGLPSHFKKIPHIVLKPSFLLFQDNSIIIVEVTDKRYTKYLYKKKNYFEMLQKKFSFFYYKFVDKEGNNLN
jgi:hypothetical protein